MIQEHGRDASVQDSGDFWYKVQKPTVPSNTRLRRHLEALLCGHPDADAGFQPDPFDVWSFIAEHRPEWISARSLKRWRQRSDAPPMLFIQEVMGYDWLAGRDFVEQTLRHYARHRHGAPLVYFLGWRHMVKIGFTRSLEQRLDTLRLAMPERGRLVGICWGNRIVEKALHEAFSQHRVHGEWFTKTQEIEAFIIQNGFRQF